MSATYGVPGQPTYSIELNGIDQILTGLPDNSNNLINAQNVRNAFFTLYNQIIGISQSLASVVDSLSASNVIYNNTDAALFTVGGINQGTTFSNVSVQKMFDDMFYPYVRPVLSLSSGTSQIEFGSTASISINFSATKRKNDIRSYRIEGGLNPSNGLPFSSTSATSPVLVRPIPSVSSTTFTYSVDDFNTTDNSGFDINSVQVTRLTLTIPYRNGRYRGTIDLSSIGDPNLTLNPGSASIVSSFITNSTILGLTKELSTTRAQTLTNFGGVGYITFAWPTSFGNPSLAINGAPNTAWTKVLSSWTFSNTFGYEELYDVWVFNTKNNSPINSIIIS